MAELEDFTDFPQGMVKEGAANIKAAIEALANDTANSKKTTLQAFDRLTCPTATDPFINRAEAYILFLGAKVYISRVIFFGRIDCTCNVTQLLGVRMATPYVDQH